MKTLRYIAAFVWYFLYVGLGQLAIDAPRAVIASHVVAFVGFAFLYYLAGEAQ